MIGTADDGDVEEIHLPGSDGQLGTGDDLVRPLTNFERQIQFNPVLRPDTSTYPDLREIVITVRYTTSQGWQRSLELRSHISRYR